MVEAANEAARSVGQFFEDRIAVLEAVAAMPSLGERDLSAMQSVLDGIATTEGLGFRGGLGWADTDGRLRVTTARGMVPADLSGRAFVHTVLSSGTPQVSQTLSGILGGEPAVVVAVPTFVGEEVDGMLVAAVLVEDMLRQVPILAPQGLEMRVVDRAGQIILENGRPVGPVAPANLSLLDPRGPSSLIGTGLNGDRHRMVAISWVERSGWALVLEQSHTLAVSDARRGMVAEIGVLVGMLVVTSGLALVGASRVDTSHKQLMRSAQDLAILELLGSRMASASEPRDVAVTALGVFAEVFSSDTVTIGLIDGDRVRVLEADRNRGIIDSTISVHTPSILVDAYNGDRPLALSARRYARAYPGDPETPNLVRGAAGVLATRFSGRLARGAVAISLGGDFPPPAADIELFEAMTVLLPGSLGRAIATERERVVSREFQHALLPRDTIGIEVPLQRAVRYMPAAGDVEVGGDWYDLWPVDGAHIAVVVGDVVGRGVKAAAAMGQMRSALRVAVAGAESVGEALGNLDEMTRHLPGSPSATVLVGSLDLDSGVVSLTSGGHLPPLVAGDNRVRVLDELKGVPVGFLDQQTRRATMAVRLHPGETLVFYTDGLIERREETIDQGIARLVEALRANCHLPLESLSDALVEACLEPGRYDDVALVCLRLVGDVAEHFSCVFEVADYPRIEKAIRRWLEAHRYPEELVEGLIERVTTAVATVAEAHDPEEPGEIMLEVDRSVGMTVTIEHRRPAFFDPPLSDSVVLAAWPDSRLGPRGPQMRFSLAVPESADG